MAKESVIDWAKIYSADILGCSVSAKGFLLNYEELASEGYEITLTLVCDMTKLPWSGERLGDELALLMPVRPLIDS